MATANVRSQSGASPNMGLRMSPHALNAMRNTEKVMLKYYNDMGRTREIVRGGSVSTRTKESVRQKNCSESHRSVSGNGIR